MYIITGLLTLKCAHFAEEYEMYMKKHEATFKTEVTTMVQEPAVGDVAPAELVSSTTIISGQVSSKSLVLKHS